ncbi:MAG TPA: Mpo1-like protein [Gammaproteobacteria bacterium]|nr:Mpo1-like protein [Gammaproteobacteria bacterium]
MPHESDAASSSRLTFLQELREQRWDDHRYYHHSRINQSLHLLSALSFLTSYALMMVSPSIAAILGWFVAMWSRQVGHFFFEPKGFDAINGASHEHKEDIKVGYNLRRKVVLLAIWAGSPFVLWLDPTLFGLMDEPVGVSGFVGNVALVWLALGAAGLLFRTVQLFFQRSVQTGLVWATKILTDPFHDLKLYHRSPLYVLRGQLIDPMIHVRHVYDVVDDVVAELEPLDDDEPELRPAG